MRPEIVTGLLLVFTLAVAAAASAATPYPPIPSKERLVGIAYTTWHTDPDFPDRWGTPLLGGYASDDRHVIRRHAAWLADAGVDFVWIDWSNNVNYAHDPDVKNPTFDMIEGATTAIFEEYARMRAGGKRRPISASSPVSQAPPRLPRTGACSARPTKSTSSMCKT